MAPLAYTIPQAIQATGIGKTKLYELIGSGVLPARKVGARTLILVEDLQKFLNELPSIGGV